MTKHKNSSKPSGSKGKDGSPKRTVSLSSGRDEVKSRPAKASARGANNNSSKAHRANNSSKAHKSSSAPASVARKDEPSMFANQMQFLETMFRWTPLGFFMRYQELERERAEKAGGQRSK